MSMSFTESLTACAAAAASFIVDFLAILAAATGRSGKGGRW